MQNTINSIQFELVEVYLKILISKCFFTSAASNKILPGERIAS